MNEEMDNMRLSVENVLRANVEALRAHLEVALREVEELQEENSDLRHRLDTAIDKIRMQ